MTISMLRKELEDIGYGTQIQEPKSLKNQLVEIIPSMGRVETYNDLASKLKKYNAVYQDDYTAVAKQIGRSYSSSAGAVIFPQSAFDNLAIRVLTPTSNVGPKTADHETYSALCFIARLNDQNTGFSLEDLQKSVGQVKSSVTRNKEDVAKLFSKVMTQDWKNSCAAQTKTFFDKERLVGKNYTVERQQEGPITKHIYSMADRLIKELSANNEKFALFAQVQLDKWNPGDIWVVKDTVKTSDFDQCKTINHLNEVIYEMYLDKKLIGVSLKKWDKKSDAPYDKYNMGSINFYGKFDGYNLGQEGGFSYTNNNMVVKYRLVNTGVKTGKAVVRPFTGTDVSAEIEGVSAAGGKAGRTFINKVLTQMGKPNILSYKDIKPRMDTDVDSLYEEFFMLAKKSKYGPKEKTAVEFRQKIKEKYKTVGQEKSYVSAKMQAASFAASLETLTTSEKDTLVDMMICYAASSLRDISSPFIKIGK